MTNPSIAIITPSFNHASYIRQTIDSVLSQNYSKVDYWVIDGGSSDETVKILRSYGDRLHWVSEPDHGQADAINKGFNRSTGDIVAWLNSDDFYEPGTLQKVTDYFSAHPEIDFICGDMNFVDIKGKNPQPCNYLSNFSFARLLKYCYICQPSVFFRRSVIDAVGPLNSQYTYVFDYDYWLRIGRLMPSRIARVNLGVLANLRTYQSRKTEAGLLPMRREIITLMLAHGYWYAPAILESIYQIINNKLFNHQSLCS